MSYRTRDQLLSDYLALEATYPTEVSHEVIGKTVQGRDILLFKIGNPRGGKVMFNAAIHGDEKLGAELHYFMLKYVLQEIEPSLSRTVLNAQTLLVPIFNVDNYGITRKNANGVDLNRNFPVGWGGAGSSPDPTKYNYRGTAPASEPETKAMLACITRYLPQFFLDFHQADPTIYFAKPSANAKLTAEQIALSDKIASDIRAASLNRTGFQYPSSTLGISGCLTDSAFVYGKAKAAYLIEADTSYTVPYADIEAVHMKRILPFDLVFATNAIPDTDISVGGLVIAGIILALIGIVAFDRS